MKVMTFARFFPSYHPKKGQPTHFVEKIWKSFMGDDLGLPTEFHNYVDDYVELLNSKEPIQFLAHYSEIKPKGHTIRVGHRWKAGDWFSPRVWSDKAYRSHQIAFAPPIEVKKTWDIELLKNGLVLINKKEFLRLETLAQHDGLTGEDFNDWFIPGRAFDGQIICWDERIEYDILSTTGRPDNI